MDTDLRPPLAVIVGPTGVGKTDLAIQLAERLQGEIVSADSRLLYRGMDIGTAKPTAEQRLRVPHHLIDVTDPDQNWSLALFQCAARQVIASIHTRGHLPFLVGGTGQYVHAVIEGWQVPQGEPNIELRHALERWAGQISPDGLHVRLASLDPEAANRIDPRNLRRTIRALEVILMTGRRFSEQRLRLSSSYRTMILGLSLSRPELYVIIDARIQAMLDAGLVDEVRSLLACGYSPDLPTFSAIGYREIIDYLRGETSLEEAIVQMKRRTRIFVRRQANWFRTDDANIHWFEAGPKALEETEAALRAWLVQVR